MLRHGRGVLCAPITKDTANRLDLRPIVEESANTAPHRTPFLVQVDHVAAGTGVSPEARAGTLREMANPHSVASDFVKPGHIFPLLAKPGGVLRRAGHTEAVTDLMHRIGQCHLKLGELEEAKRVLRKALRLDPGNAPLRNDYERAKAGAGRSARECSKDRTSTSSRNWSR